MTKEETLRANKTFVRKPIHKPITYDFAWDLLKIFSGLNVLDFGAGKYPLHKIELQKYLPQHHFFSCDMGENFTSYHDFNSLENTKKYMGFFDVVIASNVLNVQINKNMMHETLERLFLLTNKDGFLLFNYPSKPRLGGFSTKEIYNFMLQYYNEVKREDKRGIFSAWK